MTAQADIFQYAAEQAASARDAGMHSARTGDPGGFEADKAAIREAVRRYGTITSDDVVTVRTNTLGAAFRELARAGEIVHVGYRKSRRQRAHARDVKIWAAAP